CGRAKPDSHIRAVGIRNNGPCHAQAIDKALTKGRSDTIHYVVWVVRCSPTLPMRQPNAVSTVESYRVKTSSFICCKISFNQNTSLTYAISNPLNFRIIQVGD